jgi:uncharacterized protein
MNDLAEITVTATGSVKEMPDGIRIDMTVNAQKADYAQTLEQLNQMVVAVNAALAKARVNSEATTQSYEITEVWTDPYDEDKRKLLGYRGKQKMSVTIEMDNEVLGRAIVELSACKGNPNIGVTFVVQNTEPMEKTARITAVKKARDSAGDLADAAGLKLVAVKSITYTSTQNANGSSLYVSELALFDVPTMPMVKPDAVSHKEGVKMIWLAAPMNAAH